MEKLLLYSFYLISVVITSTSCKPIYEKVFQDQYSKQDTIFVCDYMMINGIKQEGLFRTTFTVEETFTDSIFTICRRSFNQLEIELYTHNSVNAVDSNFLLKKYNFSYRYPPTELILKVAETCNKEIVMVPLIELYHSSTYSIAYFTAFIVRGNEIIYAHGEDIKSKYYNAADHYFKERPFNQHTEKDWNELIKGAMQPYLDRLK